MAHQTPEFEAKLLSLMQEWRVPGLALAIIKGDSIYSKGYGFTRPTNESSNLPVTPSTLFDCASTSKSFTAAATALLVHSEEFPDLSWTTPVSQVLPDDFVLPDPYSTAKVTIEDILSHRSGMPRHDESYLGVKAAHPDTPRSLTRNLRNLPLTRPLRTEFQYNNMMFTVASYLVEVLGGMPYAEYLREHFWRPLQMDNTYHDYDEVTAGGATARLAYGHLWDEKTDKYVEVPFIEQPEGQGAGCIFSSVDDYAKWVRALLNRAGPLSPAAHKDLAKPRIICDEEDEDRLPFCSTELYALGLGVYTYRGRTVYSHSGGVPGFTSLLSFVPELEWGVYMIGNSGDASTVAEILFYQLLDELMGIPASEQVDWAAVMRERRDKFKREDEEADLAKRRGSGQPMSLPIDRYTGKYHNVGYHDIVVEVKDGKLWADCSDRCYGGEMTFDHVSADVFVAATSDASGEFGSKKSAEFRIGDKDTAESLGVEFEEKMDGRKIWFKRVE